MKRIIFYIFLTVIIGTPTLFGQGFEAPSEGKAVVYFTRVTFYGATTSFDFFHQDKYIGTFNQKNYMRYECEPGEQLFWASSENKEFITADLEAGKSYIVMINVIIGAWKLHVGLEPIGPDHKSLDRAIALIKSKPPIEMKEKHYNKILKKLEKRDFMKNNLDRYESELKGVKNFNHISKEMAVPEEKM